MSFDIIKEEYIIELRKLQDEVPAFDFVEAKHIIQQELGKPLNEMLNAGVETVLGSTADIGAIGFILAMVIGLFVVLKILRV